MRLSGLSYLRDLCLREEKMVHIQNKNNIFVQRMRRAQEEGHHTDSHTVIQYESDIERDNKTKEKQKDRIDRYSKIDDFIKRRLCMCKTYSHKQIQHLIVLITHDYVDFMKNSKGKQIYVKGTKKAEFFADGKDIFDDGIKFCTKVLKEHEASKDGYSIEEEARVEEKIENYVKFRFCVTYDFATDGENFLEVHTRLSYLRFCKNSIIEEITKTSTPYDNKSNKRPTSSENINFASYHINNKGYKKRSKTNGEFACGESVSSNTSSDSSKNQTESDLFQTFMEEDSKVYRCRQRARIGILFQEVKQLKNMFLEMKNLNERYEHPVAACARIEQDIVATRKTFEEKSTTILHGLEKISEKVKQNDEKGLNLTLKTSQDCLNRNQDSAIEEVNDNVQESSKDKGKHFLQFFS